jgi:15-cis-phytoene synthase
MIALRSLVLAYAPRSVRPHLSALLDLDTTLGRIVASTTDPIIGQMRLTWWHEQLTMIENSSAPVEPVLASLKRYGIVGADVATMIDGWEALLDPMPLNDAALRLYADHRGERLFSIAANLCDQPVAMGLGAGWALVDFAMRCSDPQTVLLACSMAREYLAAVKITGPKPLRILAHVSRSKAMQSHNYINDPVRRMMILNAILR